jgi:hypothetical protein
MAKNLTIAAVKQDRHRRSETGFACPLFARRMFSLPIRPLVCRAMHASAASAAEAELHSGSLACSQYGHRHEIALSVSAGILAGSQVENCQSRIVSLSRALHDFFTQKNCVERWIVGEAVFSS